MTATAFKLPRPLNLIALDLATTRQRLATFYAPRIGNLTSSQEAEWGALEDRKLALEIEFKDQFLALSGVEWSLAESVMQ